MITFENDETYKLLIKQRNELIGSRDFEVFRAVYLTLELCKKKKSLPRLEEALEEVGIHHQDESLKKEWEEFRKNGIRDERALRGYFPGVEV